MLSAESETAIRVIQQARDANGQGQKDQGQKNF
jgi:hypothetical protein